MPKGKTSVYKRRLKRRLYNRQGGRCFYRHGRMQPPENPLPTPHPNDLATLEHLRDRHHPGRLEPPAQGEKRIVLACLKCNRQKGRESHFKAIGKMLPAGA